MPTPLGKLEGRTLTFGLQLLDHITADPFCKAACCNTPQIAQGGLSNVLQEENKVARLAGFYTLGILGARTHGLCERIHL